MDAFLSSSQKSNIYIYHDLSWFWSVNNVSSTAVEYQKWFRNFSNKPHYILTHHSHVAGLTGSACGFSVSFQLEEFITEISLPSKRRTSLCLCSLICQHMWISEYYYWRSLYCCYISLCQINQTIGKYASFYLQKLTLNLKSLSNGMCTM